MTPPRPCPLPLRPTWAQALRQCLATGLMVLAMLVLTVPAPAHAQDRAAAAATAAPDGRPALPSVDDLRKQLDAIPRKLAEDDDGRKLLDEAAAIGTAADQVAARRTEELADIDSRLAGLGPAPEKGAPADAPDVAEQRASLARQRSAVDSELKLARLVSVDADQRGNELIRQRREQFQAALTARTDSPLGRPFWRNLRAAAPLDAARLQGLGRELRQTVASTMASDRRGGFIASLAAALLIALLGPWLAERLLVRAAPARLPSGRLRRSLRAAATVLINTLLIGLAAQLAWSVLKAGDGFSESLDALAKASVQVTLFGAFVVSLGQTLLSRRRSSWRLPGVSDELAERLSPYPWWIAAGAALNGLVTEVNAIIGASLAAEVTVHALSALLISAVVMLALRHLRAPAPVAQEDGAQAEPAPPRPLWVGLLVACAAVASIATIALAVTGYVALAGTLARQMVWTGVVFATTYLLFQLGDDLCEALLSSKGSFGTRLNQSLGIEGRLLDQASVLVSGLLRVALLFYMVIALLAPLGTGPDEVFRRGSTVNHSLKVGDFTMAPQALFTAFAVIVTGLIVIRVIKRWLTDRYFPNTSLEPGMRSSITTLLGYVGGIFVVAVALAGLGISVERIAWVASALSVGIGFGLQAIVQNFISGLILLAERPVKVGDWVVLGDTEGDVRRVNVRATEIQLGDRSTVIVPNSEFITKTVRNMTLAGAPGRVLLRLPAPLDTDAERMRTLILEAFRTHEGILDTPEPLVQLEGIANGTLTFLAIGYVGNPRNAGGVRSDVLFSILASLKGAGLYLSPPATTSVAAPVVAGMPGSPGTPPMSGDPASPA